MERCSPPPFFCGVWRTRKLAADTKNCFFLICRRSPLTFAVPIVVTTALSGVLIKILNR